MNISFDESDNLSLKTFSIETELNSSATDLIRNLKDENDRLIQLSREKDFEIIKLKRNIDKKENIKENLSDGAASLKIIELSKKLREMTSDCESWKRKCYEKAKEVKLSVANDNKINKNEVNTVVKVTESENELKIIKEKLKLSENKVLELLTTNQNMSRELKVAMKVLENELGENCVDLNRLLKDPGQWRGRAQKITSLKETIDRLERQLKEEKRFSAKEICSGATSLDITGDMSNYSSSTQKTRQNLDILTKLEKEKRINIDKIEEERLKITEECNKLKSTSDGFKARNKYLSDEIKSYKQQIKNMLNKTKNDDELIASLILQQDRLKDTLQSMFNNQQTNQINNIYEINHAVSQCKQDQDTVSKLKEIIELKDKELRNIKENKPKLQSKDERNCFSDEVNIDFEQLKISSVSLTSEIVQLREIIKTEELRLESLLQKNMTLSEENSRLKQNCFQLEREIQKIAPNNKFKTKLKLIKSSEELSEGSNIASLLSEDFDVNKDNIEKLQEEIRLKIDKIESLKSALELMALAKKEDVKMLSDIIDQTRNQFVDSIQKLKGQCLRNV